MHRPTAEASAEPVCRAQQLGRRIRLGRRPGIPPVHEVCISQVGRRKHAHDRDRLDGAQDVVDAVVPGADQRPAAGVHDAGGREGYHLPQPGVDHRGHRDVRRPLPGPERRGGGPRPEARGLWREGGEHPGGALRLPRVLRPRVPAHRPDPGERRGPSLAGGHDARHLPGRGGHQGDREEARHVGGGHVVCGWRQRRQRGRRSHPGRVPGEGRGVLRGRCPKVDRQRHPAHRPLLRL
mmetsp:Transcript_25298/g.60184  ORF Transcript_25298/g.60184 Transcript_25298/m.60184 type:complete len:237 (-) Transcript_25298:1157-1867(-)